jgi:hypothetical protein
MGEYDRPIATAKRLIEKKGQVCTWIQHILGTPSDADKPWLTGNDEIVSLPVSIVFLSANRINNEFIRALLGTEVTVGTVKGIMAGQTFEPTKKDIVIRGDKTLRIKNIDPVKPAEDAILHIIEFNE